MPTCTGTRAGTEATASEVHCPGGIGFSARTGSVTAKSARHARTSPWPQVEWTHGQRILLRTAGTAKPPFCATAGSRRSGGSRALRLIPGGVLTRPGIAGNCWRQAGRRVALVMIWLRVGDVQLSMSAAARPARSRATAMVQASRSGSMTSAARPGPKPAAGLALYSTAAPRCSTRSRSARVRWRIAFLQRVQELDAVAVLAAVVTIKPPDKGRHPDDGLTRRGPNALAGCAGTARISLPADGGPHVGFVGAGRVAAVMEQRAGDLTPDARSRGAGEHGLVAEVMASRMSRFVASRRCEGEGAW